MIPQGSILGPLYFSATLMTSLNLTSKVRLYADDTLIYHNFINDPGIVALQNDLNATIMWSIDWQMTFNPNKSEFRITNKVNHIWSDYPLRNCQIPLVNHAKYLGVIIDKYLNWTEHVNMITANANSIRGFLQHNLSKCPTHVKNSSYVTYVRPMLDYSRSLYKIDKI